jgi:segregation and condensation protein B
VSNDEHTDSLASQAASWVPPWERAQRPPDRAYQAAAEEEARAEAERRAAAEDAVEAELTEIELAGDGQDPETPALDGDARETLGVDSPAGVGRGPEPSAGELGPELPVPDAVEQAVLGDDEDGQPADLPLPLDGDDAGDVFDTAADDDLNDDEDVDLVAVELVPADDEIEGTDPEGAELVPADGELEGADSAAAGLGPADDQGKGADPAVAELVPGDDDDAAAEPAAASVGDPGRGRGGSAVPEQGRRRRNGPQAVGDGWGRTSEGAEPAAERGPSDVAEPTTSPVDVPESSDLPPLMEDAELAAALEAILLVVDEPVGEMQLAQILEQPTERVGEMLEDLSARYTGAGHGFDLRRAAGGWRLYTRPEYAAYVERFVLDGQSVRLTQAALETLAVVAYKQPVTRSRISAIRGVNCDGVMRTLVTRGLIEECGTEGETGAHLYRTTPIFLEKLGLNSVDQLPPLAPFLPDDVEEVLDASG